MPKQIVKASVSDNPIVSAASGALLELKSVDLRKLRSQPDLKQAVIDARESLSKITVLAK